MSSPARALLTIFDRPALLGTVLVSFLGGCTSPLIHDKSDNEPDNYGKLEEPLLLTDMDGHVHSTEDAFREGQRVALVFWMTWCKKCLQEGPALAEAARAHAGRVQFFGIVSGPDRYVDDQEVRRVAGTLGLPYPQIRDRDLDLARKFQIESTPTIILLDSGGAVLFRGHGLPRHWTDDCDEETPSPREQMRERVLTVMGTELQIRSLGPDPGLLDRAMEDAVKEIQRVENLMTDWRASELTSLNSANGQGPRKVPRELAAIIARGLEVGRLTGGAFDITYLGVGELWDFKKKPFTVPVHEKIRSALAHVDFQRVTVDSGQNTVNLPRGMKIGLGGIAKGYGVDRAMTVLMKSGVKQGIVNAGGDLKVLGLKNGQPWEIAIKHPRDRERVMAVLKLSNQSLATSGDYERFGVKDGKRYHHIIDPRTGYPSEGCLSASVVAPSAEFADSLATAMCVMGPEKGLKLIEKLDRVEAIVVGMDGVVHVSTGLKGSIQ